MNFLLQWTVEEMNLWMNSVCQCPKMSSCSLSLPGSYGYATDIANDSNDLGDIENLLASLELCLCTCILSWQASLELCLCACILRWQASIPGLVVAIFVSGVSRCQSIFGRSLICSSTYWSVQQHEKFVKLAAVYRVYSSSAVLVVLHFRQPYWKFWLSVTKIDDVTRYTCWSSAKVI